MGRKKKNTFSETPKMLSSRVEQSDYTKFEFILKNRDFKNIQEALNIFVKEYINGKVMISGSQLVVGENK